jgi:hypothetical protein
MPKIGPDKWKHLYVGILMGAGLQGMAVWLLPAGLLWPSIIALLLVVSISYEIMDAIFSVVGGIIGMSAVLLVLVM